MMLASPSTVHPSETAGRHASMRRGCRRERELQEPPDWEIRRARRGGTVYVSSGYGMLGYMPGNLLLAFSVDGQ